MEKKLVKKYEIRGLDKNQNPFADFGFAEQTDDHYLFSSYIVKAPLHISKEGEIVQTFQQRYEEEGFSKIRYKVIWENGTPVENDWVQL
ncbi:MAG: hypothetical protein HY731_08305 [Candidatus Tectomicrobia bacterium]|nr:hypothetical protein [Candidatus Tectomicrobia bacterium]